MQTKSLADIKPGLLFYAKYSFCFNVRDDTFPIDTQTDTHRYIDTQTDRYFIDPNNFRDHVRDGFVS